MFRFNATLSKKIATWTHMKVHRTQPTVTSCAANMRTAAAPASECVPSPEAAEWVGAAAYRCSASHSSCWSCSEVSPREDGEPRHGGAETEWNMRSQSQPTAAQIAGAANTLSKPSQQVHSMTNQWSGIYIRVHIIRHVSKTTNKHEFVQSKTFVLAYFKVFPVEEVHPIAPRLVLTSDTKHNST